MVESLGALEDGILLFIQDSVRCRRWSKEFIYE